MDQTRLNNPLLSLLVPVYNEEGVIDIFLKKVQPILQSCPIRYEIIFINDGSQDNTLLALVKAKEACSEIVIIDFSRNFGKEAALTAGLEYARGDVVVPIDVDLQDPPELIPKMLVEWQKGYDQVLAARVDRRSDSVFKRVSAKFFYSVFNRLSENDLPKGVGDYRLMDRKVVNALLKLPEKNRFMKGIFNWVGFKTVSIEFKREKRVAGKTSWGIFKLCRFALDGIFSFSVIPLKIWTYIGLAISFFAGIYIVEVIVKAVILGRDVHGYSSLMVTILFMAGIQLLSLGILGEYIARIYIESKNRPLYIVNQIYDREK